MPMVDWIFLTVLLASLALGAWRGLVYEVLSVLSWLAAFVLAQWLGPDLAHKLPMEGYSEMVRAAAGFVGVFILAVFAASLLTKLIKKLVDSAGMRPADRALGAMFGAARGVIVLLVMTVVVEMTSLKTSELWAESAGAGVSLAALKGLKPVMPEKFAQYFP